MKFAWFLLKLCRSEREHVRSHSRHNNNNNNNNNNGNFIYFIIYHKTIFTLINLAHKGSLSMTTLYLFNIVQKFRSSGLVQSLFR